MFSKKIAYQITRTRFIMVEVKNEGEERAIRELNKDCERVYMQERRLQARSISLDNLKEVMGIEPSSRAPAVDEIVIENEMKNALKAAIRKLTDKQRDVIRLYFWKHKTMKAIAEEKHLHISTVSECLASSIKKLKNLLQHPEKMARSVLYK